MVDLDKAWIKGADIFLHYRLAIKNPVNYAQHGI